MFVLMIMIMIFMSLVGTRLNTSCLPPRKLHRHWFRFIGVGLAIVFSCIFKEKAKTMIMQKLGVGRCIIVFEKLRIRYLVE